MKVCKSCGETKDFNCFSKKIRNKDGLQNDCKLCVSAYKKEYYLTNKDKIKEKANEYYFENKEKVIKSVSDRYQKEKSKIKKYLLQYREMNKGKINYLRNKYRVAKLKATPNWLNSEQLNQIEKLYVESQQLTSSTGVQHHVDHIIPLQSKTVCGLHVPWNLQILTKTENIKKSNSY